MRKLLLSTTAFVALVAPANAASCISAPSSLYTSSNFSCNVDGFTFSNMTISVVTSTGATVNEFAMTIDPVRPLGGSGLQLNYLASADSTKGLDPIADITWRYNVVGVPSISGAYLALDGSTTGAAVSQTSEVFFGAVPTISLNAPGTVMETFAPVFSLFVSTDHVDQTFGGLPGFAESHTLVNAFTSTQFASVPAPIAGTGLSGLFVACLGFAAYWRRQRSLRGP
jgi:hypothetical protein